MIRVRGNTQKSEPVSIRRLVRYPSLLAAMNVGSPPFPTVGSCTAGGISLNGGRTPGGTSSGPWLLAIWIVVFAWFSIATLSLDVMRTNIPAGSSVTWLLRPLSSATCFLNSASSVLPDETQVPLSVPLFTKTLAICGRVSRTRSAT